MSSGPRSSCSPAARRAPGVAAVAEGAQDYLVKGQVDGGLLDRAAALRRGAQARRREARGRCASRAAAAESARLERGLLPKPLMTADQVRCTPSTGRAGHRARARRRLLRRGAPTAPVRAADRRRLRARRGRGRARGARCGSPGGPWCSPGARRPDPGRPGAGADERAPPDELFATVATVTVDLADGPPGPARRPSAAALLAGGRVEPCTSRRGPRSALTGVPVPPADRPPG